MERLKDVGPGPAWKPLRQDPGRTSRGAAGRRHNRALDQAAPGPNIHPPDIQRKSAVAGANDQGGRREAGPRSDAPRASAAWSIPEIRVFKDDQGRLRIDQADPATYGAYLARQFLATAEADPRYRGG